MRILVIGAGAIGSVYAARLQEANNDVTLLARDRRAKEIKRAGVILEEAASGLYERTPMRVIEVLPDDETFDLTLVTVPRTDLASVLKSLANHQGTPAIVVMTPVACGEAEVVEALGSHRAFLSLTGVRARQDGRVTRYVISPASVQATAIGEPGGRRSREIETIAILLEHAGFPVDIRPDIDGVLKSYAAWVVPVAAALRLAGSDHKRFARTTDAVVMMVRARRECHKVIHALDVEVVPWTASWSDLINEPTMVGLSRLALATGIFSSHYEWYASHHLGDVRALARDLVTMARQTAVSIPYLAMLLPGLDDHPVPMEDGSNHIPISWRDAALIGAGGLAVGGAVAWRRLAA